MARQRIRVTKTTTRKVKKSNTTTDSRGRTHCKTCGAFLGKRKK